MSDTWKQWEGQTVNGEFPLLQFVGGSEQRALFLTVRREGERLVRAAIRLIATNPESGELQLSRWRQAAVLFHPHLIRLYEMGRCELGGEPLLYVVMECAEENLAQVLLDRPLTQAEARTMLEAVVEVLVYLHDKGFVHSQIKPANIMAIGDLLKVSSDRLRRAGESLESSGKQDAHDPPEIAPGIIPAPQTQSPAADVWSLGMTLVETLTQNLPIVRTTKRQDPLIPQILPGPFLDVARHCLVRNPKGRWTVAQIAARLGERDPAPQVQTVLAQAGTQSPTRQSKRRSYAVPIAVGFVLVLSAILAGPKLLRRHSDLPPVPTITSEQPLASPTLGQVAASPQEAPEKAPRLSIVEEEPIPRAPIPVPALVHPETIHEEETNLAAKLSAGGLVHGEIAQQAMPEVLQSARDTIRGTVKVNVKVNVDRSGNVEDAKLELPGPSRYFARAALEAAQLWKFQPPKVGGRGVLSSWTLQFKFTRDETTVDPTQEMP